MRHVKTADGTSFGYEDLKLSEQMELMRVVGTDVSANPDLFEMAATMASVREFNGVLQRFPETFATIKQVADKIGVEGLKALQDDRRRSQALAVGLPENASWKEIADARMDATKNSPGTLDSAPS